MVNVVADRDGEPEKDNLGDGEDDGVIAQALSKRAKDEKELGEDVNCGTDEWPKDVNDPEGDRARVLEAGELLESRNCDEETESKNNKA